MSADIASTFLEAEIATQPDDWRRAKAEADAYRALLPEPGERVAVVGCGTSLYMSQAYAGLRESKGEGLTDAWPASEHRLTRDYDRVVAITEFIGPWQGGLDAAKAVGARLIVTLPEASRLLRWMSRSSPGLGRAGRSSLSLIGWPGVSATVITRPSSRWSRTVLARRSTRRIVAPLISAANRSGGCG